MRKLTYLTIVGEYYCKLMPLIQNLIHVKMLRRNLLIEKLNCKISNTIDNPTLQ